MKLFDASQRLQKTYRLYLTAFRNSPNERLLEQLANGEDLWNRKNYRGHVTASAIVLSADRSQTLLIRNRNLDRWLAPGGHCDPYEMPIESAQRELREETGLACLPLLEVHSHAALPIDVDTHRIPANPKKGEEEHFHHDFRYVFVAESDSQTTFPELEISGLDYYPVKELERAYPRVFSRLSNL